MTRYLANSNAVLAILCFLLAMTAAICFIELRDADTYVKKTCSDFATYQEALQSYKKGDIGLDKNRDDIPCNALFDKNGIIQ